MKRLIRILPHVTIILSAMFITLWFLDKYNPLMNFLDSDLSNTLLMVFCILSMITAIVMVAIERKSGKK